MKSLFLLIFAAKLGIAGVLNGGGGNVIDPSLNMYRLREIIVSARAELHMFFSAHRKKKSSPEFSKIYSSKKSIIETIKNTKIYLSEKGCFDSNNKETDGSIISPIADTICLNERSLVTKLRPGTARNEVLALAAHEYSHLHGYDEDEAADLQWKVIELLDQDSADRVKKSLEDTLFRLGLFNGGIANYKNSFEEKNWNISCFNASTLSDYLADIRKNEWLSVFSVFSDEQYNSFLAYEYKLQLLRIGVCSKSDYYPGRFNDARKYKNLFGSRIEIGIDEVARKIGIEDVHSSLVAKKIISFKDEEHELEEIATFMDGIQLEINGIKKMMNSQIYTTKLF